MPAEQGVSPKLRDLLHRLEEKSLCLDRQAGKGRGYQRLRREESELRLAQAERNVATLTGRAFETVEHGAGLLAGGAARVVTTPVRGATEISLNNTTADARVNYLRDARGSHLENYEYTGQLRLDASDDYARAAGKIADTQAADPKALDTSCLARSKPAPFFTSPAGPPP